MFIGKKTKISLLGQVIRACFIDAECLNDPGVDTKYWKQTINYFAVAIEVLVNGVASDLKDKVIFI